MELKKCWVFPRNKKEFSNLEASNNNNNSYYCYYFKLKDWFYQMRLKRQVRLCTLQLSDSIVTEGSVLTASTLFEWDSRKGCQHEKENACPLLGGDFYQNPGSGTAIHSQDWNGNWSWGREAYQRKFWVISSGVVSTQRTSSTHIRDKWPERLL